MFKLFILLILPLNLLAQVEPNSIKELNLESICKNDKLILGGVDYITLDEGFCEVVSEIEKENESVDEDFVTDLNTTLVQIPSMMNNLSNSCFSEDNHSQVANINLVGNLLDKSETKNKWIFRFYASHSSTTYYDTDISFRSSRYNVDIKDYTWTERHSRTFFNPKFFHKAQTKYMKGMIDGVAVDGVAPLTRPIGAHQEVLYY